MKPFTFRDYLQAVWCYLIVGGLCLVVVAQMIGRATILWIDGDKEC